MVELVDTPDSKSCEGNLVTVQVRPAAPYVKNLLTQAKGGFMQIGEWAEIHKAEVDSRGIDLFRVDSTASFEPNTSLGAIDAIGRETRIGTAQILGGVYIGANVQVRDFSTIDRDVTLLDHARVDVMSYLGIGAVVAGGVSLPAYLVVGEDAIIPSQDVVKVYGPLGGRGRIITVHGSDHGPLYSLAGLKSVPLHLLHERFEGAIETSTESAQKYMDNMPIFEAMGEHVQTAYDKLAEPIAELRGIRDNRIAGRNS